ncbi:hypothetical protein JCM6882_007594 [Rhodosporidiobolus microsporus]
MYKTAASDAARVALVTAIPAMPLPPLPSLRSDLWKVHSSYRGGTHWEFELPEGEQPLDYERLEHVGDALLGAEVTLLIHELYPRLSVGARTAAKSVCVCNETLSLLATAFGIPSQILASQAQLLQHRQNANIQACVFEAFIAALYEEQGPAGVRDFLRPIYTPILPVVVDTMRPFHTVQAETAALPTRNFVGMILEWARAKGSNGTRGAAFGPGKESLAGTERLWTVEMEVFDQRNPDLPGSKVFRGSAATMAKAKTEAAYKACQAVGIA